MPQKIKYEYKIFEAHQNHINHRLSEWYKNGWIEAGSAYVYYHAAPTNAAFIYIPMRKILKPK